MASPGKNLTLLVVDDDEGLRLLLGDALRAEGYQVELAESGAVALKALGARQSDLMILDLRLDDMTGSELLARLRADEKSVPFIVVTGQGDEKIAVEMMKQGALDYVMKETAILDLLPTVVRRASATLQRERSLAAAVAERVRLEKEILAISENERQRFGAELHDGIGQQLTAVELMCVGLKDDVARLDATLGSRLGKISAMLRGTIADTRALARGLAPLDEQAVAFQNGLAALAAQTELLGKARCRLDCSAMQPISDRNVAGHLYRIAQEAVHNAVKHSGAREIVIKWEKANGSHRLEVSDNGRGLIDGNAGGLGLKLMGYRAGIIGGDLKIRARPGGGVTVSCVMPGLP